MLACRNVQSFAGNAILGSLPHEDLVGLRAFLQPIALKENTTLQDPRRTSDYVYFIETGVVSLRTLLSGNVIETALVGSEGVVDDAW